MKVWFSEQSLSQHNFIDASNARLYSKKRGWNR